MRYFPISIDSKDKICLFLGGGKISKRKIQSLLKGDFSFLVYGKYIDKDLMKILEENPKRVKIVEKTIDEDFVFPPCDFLFLATGDKYLNKVLEFLHQILLHIQGIETSLLEEILFFFLQFLLHLETSKSYLLNL